MKIQQSLTTRRSKRFKTGFSCLASLRWAVVPKTCLTSCFKQFKEKRTISSKTTPPLQVSTTLTTQSARGTRSTLDLRTRSVPWESHSDWSQRSLTTPSTTNSTLCWKNWEKRYKQSCMRNVRWSITTQWNSPSPGRATPRRLKSSSTRWSGTSIATWLSSQWRPTSNRWTTAKTSVPSTTHGLTT